MPQQHLVGQDILTVEISRSHSVRQTTFSKTPPDEWSAHRKYLYLTKHNTHKRQTSMPSAEFKPATPAIERPQTDALARTATGISNQLIS
jgi:hypothetical protein